MSDDDKTPPAATTTAVPEARSGWSEQDRRTLIITIGGGLAANVGTVILVGVAIAYVHWDRLDKTSIGIRLDAVLSGVLTGLVLIVIGRALWRRRAAGSRLGSQAATGLAGASLTWLGWLMLGSGLALVLVVALVLTGLAAGVK
jgi:uncharacterized membrane protein